MPQLLWIYVTRTPSLTGRCHAIVGPSCVELKDQEAATVCYVLAGSHGSEGAGVAFRGFLKREVNRAISEQEEGLDDRFDDDGPRRLQSACPLQSSMVY